MGSIEFNLDRMQRATRQIQSERPSYSVLNLVRACAGEKGTLLSSLSHSTVR